MGAPTTIDDRLVFAIDDPDHRLRQVQLACDDDLVTNRRFRRTVDGWSLAVPRPPVHRLEYRLLVAGNDGTEQVVLDPGNPHTVATAFGHRSVAHLPEYAEPDWCTAPRLDAVRGTRKVDTALGQVPVTTWAPADLAEDTPAPLLVVHDGPEYDHLAALGSWAAALVASGRIPRSRMALLQPVTREDWYGANPAWPGAVADIVDSIDADLARTQSLVTMGASLGGLAALQVALSDEVEVGGVFSQSGSFFLPHLDPQEATHPGFGRITDWVASVAARAAEVAPLDVAMTCGTHEENHANNVAMAAVLAVTGHRTDLHDLPDLHNYTAWRDGLSPTLDDLLARQWATGGRP